MQTSFPIRATAGSFLSLVAWIPTLDCLPALGAQIALLNSSSSYWTPSVCWMQHQVEPSMGLWKNKIFFFSPSWFLVASSLPYRSQHTDTWFSQTFQDKLFKTFLLWSWEHNILLVTLSDNVSWRKTSFQWSYPIKTEQAIGRWRDRVKWEEGENTTK